MVKLHPGDHVCSVYENDEQLVTIASRFLAEGLARNERCWYVPRARESRAVAVALEGRGIDVAAATGRGALRLLDSGGAYIVRGCFDPEETMRVFSAAIEDALDAGFNGFRAAAEMSWALNVPDGAESIITYEALLRALFANSPATGLCLYSRDTMPLQVLNGALLTHPIIERSGRFVRNQAYDPRVTTLADVHPSLPRRICAEGHGP